ncbi:MAG: hypothetical protein V3R80_09845 [Candidatus Tectomicrobia bacterium]
MEPACTVAECSTVSPDLHPHNFQHQKLAQAILQETPVLESKLIQNCHLPPESAMLALTEVVRFLNLIAYSNQTLTPSKLIDAVWHEFILCTKAYGEFCETYFCRMIHHHPGGSSDEHYRQQYLRTLSLYTTTFGTLDAKFWPRPIVTDHKAECGACEAASENHSIG